jgi:hypothetical protein
MTALCRKKPKLRPFEEAVRKDSAVHVSLSSDSLVKQPETSRFRRKPRPRQQTGRSRSRRCPYIRHGQGYGRMIHRVNSEGLRGRAIAPGRRYVQEPLYSRGPYGLSTVLDAQKRVLWKAPNQAAFATPEGLRRSERPTHEPTYMYRGGHRQGAALEPHSSAVLCTCYHSGYRATSGDAVSLS